MEHRQSRFRWFARVTDLARALPGVELADKYDGSPVLRVGGCFMAGLATHRSAEPESLVVRADPEERSYWLDEAPGVYYLTEHYVRHPVVLVRAGQIDDETLRDVLAASWQLTRARRRGRNDTVARQNEDT